MIGSNRKRIWLRVLVISLGIALVFCGSLVGVIAYQRWTFAVNIEKLQVGDSKERVLELLGEPRHRFAKGGQIQDVARKQNLLIWFLMSESPETWVYGSWSLLRLGATDRDYAIQFNDRGLVGKVIFPKEPEK